MNNSKRLSLRMTKKEFIWGFFYFIAIYQLVLPFLLAFLFESLGWDYLSDAGQCRLNFAGFVINFVCVLCIFHRFLWKSLGQIGKRFWGFVQAVILGWVMYQAATSLISLGLYYLRPGLQNLNNEYFQAMASQERLLTVIGTVLLVPTAEECFFRGLIFQGLHKKSRAAAYIISTLAFGLIHVIGYLGAYGWADMLLILIQYLPAGIALGWAYEKSDTIFAPILIHTIINAISMGIYAM